MSDETSGEMFDDGGDASAWALAGDEAVLSRMQPDDATEATDAVPAVAESESAHTDQPLPTSNGDSNADATAEPTDEERIARILGHFGIDTEDDAVLKLAKSHAHLQEMSSRHQTELGELRAATADTDVADDYWNAESVQAHFAENPDAILPTIQQAWQMGDRDLVAQGVAALEAVDPAQAQQLRLEIAAQDAQSTVADDVQRQYETVQMLNGAAAADPELGEFLRSGDVASVAAEFPTLGAMLHGLPAQRAEALLTLHEIQRNRANAHVRASIEDIGRATAAAAQQAREDAFVASAASASSGHKPSKAEQIGAEWDAMEAPYIDGWNVK